jgi:hypothetical protein
VGLIWLVLKRMMRKPVPPVAAVAGAAPVPEIDDPALAKYRETIERDLAKLE